MCFHNSTSDNPLSIPTVARFRQLAAEKKLGRRRAFFISGLFGTKDERHLLRFVQDTGGIKKFGLDVDDEAEFERNLAAARREFKLSGAFTDRALVPGEAPPNVGFAGPRTDTDTTGADELRRGLPLIR